VLLPSGGTTDTPNCVVGMHRGFAAAGRQLSGLLDSVLSDGDTLLLPLPLFHVYGFVGERLAPYKVPAKVTFVNELPMSAIGKVLRAPPHAADGRLPQLLRHSRTRSPAPLHRQLEDRHRPALRRRRGIGLRPGRGRVISAGPFGEHDNGLRAEVV
jgi:hypothetical protein